MKKWEYKMLSPGISSASGTRWEEREQMLGQLGADGWELVSVLEKNNRYIFFFKREVTD